MKFSKSMSIRSIIKVAAVLFAGASYAQECLDYGTYFPDPAPAEPRMFGAGETREVSAGDGLLCVATDACLQVFDVSDPEHPEFLSIVDLLPDCMQRNGNYLYVASRSGGLWVVDLTDPRNPQTTVGDELPEGGNLLAIDGGFLYVATGDLAGSKPFGLVILDLADPARPRRRGSLGEVIGWSLNVDGGRAFLSGGGIDGDGSFVTAIDVADPDNPVLIGTAGFEGRAVNAAIIEGVLYAPTITRGLRLFDVSSPTGLTHLETFDLLAGSYDIVLAPPHASITTRDGTNRIWSMDISNPRSPSTRGSTISENEASGLAHADGWTYLATGRRNPELVDMRKPRSPEMRTWTGEVPLRELYTRGVAGRGDLAYVSCDDGSLHVYDASRPDEPELINVVANKEKGGRLSIHGELLFCVADPVVPEPPKRLVVFSLADPWNPQRVGSLDMPGVVNLFAGPGAVYFPLNGRVHVVDTSDPAAPVLVEPVNPPGLGTEMAVAGNIAYCAFGSAGIHVYDVSTPTRMEFLGTTDLAGASGIQVHGNVAVAIGTDGLTTFDTTDPSALVVMGGAATPDFPVGLNLDWPLAYVGGQVGQMWIYDVSDPEDPVMIGQAKINTGGWQNDLAGNWLISAMGRRGLGLTRRACFDQDSPPVTVEIDIEPGSDINPVNCLRDAGVIPVGLLSTDTFDALTVDHTTVRFGPGEAAEIHTRKVPVPAKGGGRTMLETNLKRHEEDLDGDGDLDLVFHFSRDATGIRCGDTEAVLTGQTYDGLRITGTDWIRTVPGSEIAPEPGEMLQVSPNPFNPSTRIEFIVTVPELVKVGVFDLRGRFVAELANEPYPVGRHVLEWQGIDTAGRAVPSGIYFFRVEQGGQVEVRKALLMK